MSSIGNVPPAISQLIQTLGEQSQAESKIAYAVAGKQLQAARQTGEAVIQLLEQAVDVQSQLASGKLNVRA